jgi:hypothetical protein
VDVALYFANMGFDSLSDKVNGNVHAFFMVKIVFIFFGILLSAKGCDIECIDCPEDPYTLVVKHDTEETHALSQLKIRVNNYDMSAALQYLGKGFIEREAIENTFQQYGLNKIATYGATLPNGDIKRSIIVNALLPTKLFEFQNEGAIYTVRAVSIDTNFGDDITVTFEIKPKDIQSELAIEAIPTPYDTTAVLEENETFNDVKTDTHFYLRSYDTNQQTVTGDLILPNGKRAENIVLKPMQLIDFEHQGIKYQFGIRKIENYDCEIFVREKPLN